MALRCTDRFLTTIVAAMLHPTTKGAVSRVHDYVASKTGWSKAHLLPSFSSIYHTVFEALLRHPALESVCDACRCKCDKTVLGDDGQHSAMLSVVYQVKHGDHGDKQVEDELEVGDAAPEEEAESEKGSEEDVGVQDAEAAQEEIKDQDYASPIHTGLSVQCNESVLHVEPAESEAAPNVIRALTIACGAGGTAQVRAVASDAPIGLDCQAFWDCFPGAQCIMKDPLHVPLRVEQATHEKRNPVSKLLRICCLKFASGTNDGKEYYRRGVPVARQSALPGVYERMTALNAQNLVDIIKADHYAEQAYESAEDFVTDVAAILKVNPAYKDRRIKSKKTTIYKSLVFATTPPNLEYLMNLSRFVSRNPQIQVIYGTTRNEAFHYQFKCFFRNVFLQTARNAKVVCGIVTLAKLLAGWMRRTGTSTQLGEHELLLRATDLLMANPLTISPLLDLSTILNPVIDLDALPPNAKRLRRVRA